MKTILFIDEEESALWDSFKRYDFLLDEFEQAGYFKVCPWNQAGESVSDTIPALASLVSGESQWRAVIVTDLRQPEAVLRDDRHFDNPFDFPDRYDVGPNAPFEVSAHPIVRLTQMLGGLPEKTYVHWDDPNEEITKYSVEYVMGDEMYDVLNDYRLGVPRPEFIVCVTPHDVDEAFVEYRQQQMQQAEELAASASDDNDDAKNPLFSTMPPEELGFWQRNDYPSSARFVLCERMAPAAPSTIDVLETQTRAKAFTVEEAFETRDEWFHFWMTMLTLLSGMIDYHELRAYSVYSLTVEIREEELTALFARKRASWMTALQGIEQRYAFDLDRLKISEYDMRDLPLTQTTVPVTFDLVSRRELVADSSEVELIKDRPRDDRRVWQEQRHAIDANIKELMRAPKRALRNAAAAFRDEKPLSAKELEYCVLNQYQIDQLQEKLNEREFELSRSGMRPLFEYASTNKDFGKEDHEVLTEIDRRATYGKAIFAFCVALAVLIIGFIPYIFGFVERIEVSFSAVLITLVCCAILVVVGFATLRSMQQKVRDAYRKFNDAVNAMLRKMTGEAYDLTSNLSSYATFRKEYSIYDRQQHLEVPTEERRLLQRYTARLNRRIEELDRLAADCELVAKKLPIERDVPWETILRRLQDESFYNLQTVDPMALDGTLDDAGYRPYSFITSAHLRRLKVR